MRDDTAAWLEPMLDAAGDDVDVPALMSKATMPASETMDPMVEAFAEVVATRGEDPDGHQPVGRGIDWVQFGRLLREELGWTDYPDAPPSPS